MLGCPPQVLKIGKTSLNSFAAVLDSKIWPKLYFASEGSCSKTECGYLEQHSVEDIDSSASCSAMNNPQTLICRK